MNQRQVLSFYLNFGLGKKKKKNSTLNTQGLQSSCGAHPSQQENYMGRLPGCPDFTLLGLGFWGCDPTAPGQLGSSPPAELQHVPVASLCQTPRKEVTLDAAGCGVGFAPVLWHPAMRSPGGCCCSCSPCAHIPSTGAAATGPEGMLRALDVQGGSRNWPWSGLHWLVAGVGSSHLDPFAPAVWDRG